MKKLFLTVALVGGMLSFAAKDSAKPVMAEKNRPTNDCINWAFQLQDWFEMTYGYTPAYGTFDTWVRSCEAM